MSKIKFKKAHHQLSQEFLSEPIIAEVSDFLNVHPDIVESATNVLNIQISLDLPFNDDSENNL